MTMFKNIIYNYLGRVISLLSVYAFIPYYIKILGIERYGIIAFYTVILTLSSLADVGLSTTFSREAAREIDHRRLLDLLTTIERVMLLTASAISLGIIVSANVIASRWLNTSIDLDVETVATSLRLMALVLPWQLLMSLYVGGLLGLQRQGKANAVLASYTLVRSGLVLLPLALWPSLSTFFIWQLAISLIFSMSGRAVLVGAMGRGFFAQGAFQLRVMRPVLNFAAGMLAISAISTINTQLDKLVVSKMFSVVDFGYYSLASTLATLPVVVTAPILVAMFPRLTALNESRDHSGAAALYRYCGFAIALLASVMAFGVIFFAQELLSLWLSQPAIPAAVITVTRLLAAGGLLLSLAAVPFYLGLSCGHNRTSAVLGCASLALTLPLLIVGASHYGLVGAAIPWIVLNALSLIVLTGVIHARSYAGNAADWIVRFMALPSALGAGIALLGRGAADLVTTVPLLACVVAAGVTSLSLIAIAALAWRRRQRIEEVRGRENFGEI